MAQHNLAHVVNYWYEVELDRVVDGDTFDAWVDYGFGQCGKWRFRLNGLNTPESKTTDLREKALGLKAKALLQARMELRDCLILSHGPDKYGRLLATLYVRDRGAKPETLWENVNETLLEAGLARPYDGGARGSWFAE